MNYGNPNLVGMSMIPYPKDYNARMNTGYHITAADKLMQIYGGTNLKKDQIGFGINKMRVTATNIGPSINSEMQSQKASFDRS